MQVDLYNGRNTVVGLKAPRDHFWAVLILQNGLAYITVISHLSLFRGYCDAGPVAAFLATVKS